MKNYVERMIMSVKHLVVINQLLWFADEMIQAEVNNSSQKF